MPHYKSRSVSLICLVQWISCSAAVTLQTPLFGLQRWAIRLLTP
jgi:hypothetical protein